MAWWLALAAALAAGGEEVVARVDGAAITAASLRERMQALRAEGREPRPEEALRTLVDDEVLVAEGERRGLAKAPELAARLEAERRRLAAERFVQKEIVEAFRPDEAAIRSMFHGSADTVHLRLVALADRAQAEAALARLRGGARFADEARASLDPQSKSRGGDLGTVMRRELPAEVAEAAFAAPIGAPTGPLPYGPGWAVIQVASRRVGSEEEFGKRRAELESFARDQARQQMPKHLAQQLRKKAGASVDEAFLDRTGTRLVPEGDEARHVVARAGKSALRYQDLLADLAALSRGQQSPHMSGPAVKKELAWKRVDQMVLENEALARGFDKDPEVLSRLAAQRRLLVGTAEADRLRAGAKKPTAAEVEAWYQAHPEEFLLPARRDCSHVLVPSREAAEAAEKKLAAGEPFEVLARHMSTDQGTAAAGGRIGTISFDRLAELEKTEPALGRAMREARPGEPTAPVKSQMGWHVLRCGPVTPPGPAPLDSVTASISARLEREAAGRALQDGLAALRARARIVVDEAALNRALAGA